MKKSRFSRRKNKNIRKKWVIGFFVCAALVLIKDLVQQRRHEERLRLEEMLVETDPNLHTYTWDHLHWENGIPYYEDDTYTSVMGIDVSSHQKDIDWQAVKNSGVKFAIIQLGYRGYETGALMEDVYFRQNIQGAIENGIDVGVYFFSQAVTVEEARAEADFVLERVNGYTLQLPIVFDMEEVSNTFDRVENISRQERTQAAVTFMNHIKNAGYPSMIYSSSQIFNSLFDLDYLFEYDFWVAEYGDYPNFPYHFQIWQFTSSGTVEGISTYVDMNIMFLKK